MLFHIHSLCAGDTHCSWVRCCFSSVQGTELVTDGSRFICLSRAAAPFSARTRFSRTEKRRAWDRHQVPVCCTHRHTCRCLRLTSRSAVPVWSLLVWELLSASRPPSPCRAQRLSQEPSSVLALQGNPQSARTGPCQRFWTFACGLFSPRVLRKDSRRNITRMFAW